MESVLAKFRMQINKCREEYLGLAQLIMNNKDMFQSNEHLEHQLQDKDKLVAELALT